jgi:hypothetical protein
LYKHPAWNLFLHVLHGFLGRLSSKGLMTLEAEYQKDADETANTDIRVTDRTLHLPFEMARYVLHKEAEALYDASVLTPCQSRTHNLASCTHTCECAKTPKTQDLHRSSNTPTLFSSLISTVCRGQSDGNFKVSSR